MQRNILLIMMYVLIVLPLMMLFADDNAFFVIIALIITVFSMKNLHRMILSKNDYDPAIEEDPGAFTNIMDDIPQEEAERFGILTRIICNMIIILFYIYCIFNLNSIVAKALTIVLILYWLHETFNNGMSAEDTEDAGTIRQESAIAGDVNVSSRSAGFSISTVKVFSFIMNMGSILVILFVACNKFIRKLI